VPGIVQIEYNNPQELSDAIAKYGKNVAAFIVEPIQGEAGVVVPDENYLAKCAEICKQNNVLLIADEIQTGLARTGKMLCCEWDNVKPDLLILGKAISGGLLPLSVVLSSKDIMLCIKPGEHGSTYGGNPLAAAVGMAALQVLKDEKMAERAFVLGEKFRREIRAMNFPFVTKVRGRGLLNAIVIDEKYEKSAWDICLMLKERGLLAKPTHKHIIRLAPPLVISDSQLDECLKIIKEVLTEITSIKKEDIPLREY